MAYLPFDKSEDKRLPRGNRITVAKDKAASDSRPSLPEASTARPGVLSYWKDSFVFCRRQFLTYLYY
jgi:hypothetical protein